MSDQEIRFRVVIDDAGVPAASQRTAQGLQRIGAAAETSSKQTAAAMRALPAQFTDVATQLAGGQNPLLVLLQQGGQVKDMFGGFRPMGAALAEVLTPARLLIGGVAAAAGVFALAAFQGASESEALGRQLALTGNAANKTRGEIDALSESLASRANGPISDAREALALLAGTGAFVGDNMERAGRSVLALQKLSGQSADAIVKDMSGMSQGVAQWAAAHNKAYNYLTIEQYRLIQSLEAQGRTQDAIRVNLEALAGTMEGRAAASMGTLERAINSVKSAGAGFWDWLKDIGRPEEPEQQIKRVTEALERARKGITNLDGRYYGADGKQVAGRSAAVASLEAELAKLQEAQQARKAAADQQVKDQQQTQREIEQSSRSYQDALLGIDRAGASKRLAEALAKEADWRRWADGAYRERSISAQQYTAEIIETERARLAAEEQFAREEIALINRRVVEKPTDRLAITAARTQAEAGLVAILDKRRALEDEIDQGKFRVLTDPEVDPQGAFRRQELLNGAYEQTVQWLREQRAETVALARATSEFTLSLDRNNASRALANARDLEGRGLGDNAREQAGRLAAIADQFNSERAKLDDDLRSGRSTRDAFDQRLQILRGHFNQALADEQAYQDRRAALEADGAVGFDRALGNYLESSRNVAAQTESLFSNAFKGMEDALVSFATTGKLGFKEFANSVVADLIRIAVRRNLAGIFSGYSGSFGGGTSAAGGVNGSAGVASIDTFAANGMAFGQGGVRAFAQGGVVSQPTFFRFAQGGAMRNGVMGEAGAEGILPLRRTASGALGVIATGAAAPTTVQVNVINNTSTPVQASATTRPDGSVDVILTEIEGRIAGNVADGQGPVYAAMRSRFGMRESV